LNFAMLHAGVLRLKERGNGSFNRRLPDSFRADSNPCHLPTLRIRCSAAAGKSGGLPSQNATSGVPEVTGAACRSFAAFCNLL
jgi:hypothetical protein